MEDIKFEKPNDVPEELYRGEIIADLITRGKSLTTEDKHDSVVRMATHPYPTYARIDFELALDLIAAKNAISEETFVELVGKAVRKAASIDLVWNHEEIGGIIVAAIGDLTNLGENELATKLNEFKNSSKYNELVEAIKSEKEQQNYYRGM